MLRVILFFIICLISTSSIGGVFVYKNRRYSSFNEFKLSTEYTKIKSRVKTSNEKPISKLNELSDDLKLIKKWRSGKSPFMNLDMEHQALKRKLLQLPSGVKNYQVLH